MTVLAHRLRWITPVGHRWEARCACGHHYLRSTLDGALAAVERHVVKVSGS